MTTKRTLDYAAIKAEWNVTAADMDALESLELEATAKNAATESLEAIEDAARAARLAARWNRLGVK